MKTTIIASSLVIISYVTLLCPEWYVQSLFLFLLAARNFWGFYLIGTETFFETLDTDKFIKIIMIEVTLFFKILHKIQ